MCAAVSCGATVALRRMQARARAPSKRGIAPGRRGCARPGLRGVLCYEATPRHAAPGWATRLLRRRQEPGRSLIRHSRGRERLAGRRLSAEPGTQSERNPPHLLPLWLPAVSTGGCSSVIRVLRSLPRSAECERLEGPLPAVTGQAVLRWGSQRHSLAPRCRRCRAGTRR